MNTFMIIPVLITFLITVISGPVVIPFLRRLKFGQTVRDEGPETHKKKTGTPTMGGIMFLIPIIVVSLFFVKEYPATVPVLVLTVGFGFVGFLDDYIKVVKKRSMGLRAWQKMALQIAITALFAYYITSILEIDTAMKIPFFKGHYFDLGFFNIPMIFLVVIGTDTGSNFTDGVDGLCSSVTLVMTGFLALASYVLDSGVTPVALCFAGGLMGFLVYNLYPAKVFMGDTGALALGGFVAAMAYIMQLQIFLIVIGIIYVVEVLSVMIQVSYFKISHGKRVFKMAPIHHHFELCGWSETKVVGIFTIVTILCCVLAFDGLW